MSDNHEKYLKLDTRIKKFAVRVIRLSQSLPTNRAADVIAKQIIRSGTSVGAHYREGHRARSTAEFVSKLEVGLQELNETQYWMELLVESKIVAPKKLENLINESSELTAILVASIRTVKNKKT